MIFRRKKNEEVEEKAGGAEESKKKSKKKKRNEGSRWAALILLAVTLVLGLWFYFVGSGGFSGLSERLGGGGMSSTYVFE